MKQHQPKVSAIVVTWNSKPFISLCIESLLKSTYPVEVIVVDNDSQDGTEQYIRDTYPFLKVIQTNSNLGFAGGINVGIKEALLSQATYIFLLNPDAFVEHSCICELVHIMEENGMVGMASPKIYYSSKPNVIWFAGSNIDWKRGLTPHIGFNQLDKGQYNVPDYIERICGCAVLINSKALNQVGLMDERYFLYFEEADLSVRFTKLGYKLLYVPTAVCWHDASLSTGGELMPIYQYYMTRNTFVFMNKYGQPYFCRFVCRFLVMKVRMCITLLKLQRLSAFTTINAIFKGVGDYYFHKGGKQM